MISDCSSMADIYECYVLFYFYFCFLFSYLFFCCVWGSGMMLIYGMVVGMSWWYDVVVVWVGGRVGYGCVDMG